MKLWGSRMNKETESRVHQLNASIAFDIRLFEEDIDGSLAWARALTRAGVLTEQECKLISEGLEGARSKFGEDSFRPAPSDEDIHTAVERILTELIGPVAGKLRTGRSRNDQVATDFRLWMMRACDQLDSAILDLAEALLAGADAGLEIPMPGYTHLQPAQPVTWGHWLLSHFWSILRDRKRFAVAKAAAAILPLGSGALAGTPYPIDRQGIASELGFMTISSNSIDAVADRDFALEFLFSAAVLGVHISRLAEALILFSTSEFGFIELDDGYATSSSLMPQKKNPDPLELARGKTGRLVGHLTGLLTTLKGLPSAYDKDMQEDKEPVFDAFDSLILLLPVLAGLIRTLKLNVDRLATGLRPDLFATELADYLVRKGVAFHQAHDLVGTVVRLAEERALTLMEFPLEELHTLSDSFEQDVAQVFDVQAALSRRVAVGGTATEALQIQLESAKAALKAPPV